MTSFRFPGLLLLTLLALAAVAQTQTTEPAVGGRMSSQRIAELLARLDFELNGEDGVWHLIVAGRAVMVITDESADRMRIIAPVTAADALSGDDMARVLQANFDSALDARYAIAKNTLWSAFIHPLSRLDDEEFLIGLGQVVNLANTFGGSYSSGVMIFGGGDSRGIREKELIDELVEKGLAI